MVLQGELCGRVGRRRELRALLTALSFGGLTGGVTPDPISNSEVKTSRADGTAGGTLWESRSPPGITLKGPSPQLARAAFSFHRDPQRVPRPPRRARPAKPSLPDAIWSVLLPGSLSLLGGLPYLRGWRGRGVEAGQVAAEAVGDDVLDAIVGAARGACVCNRPCGSRASARAAGPKCSSRRARQ